MRDLLTCCVGEERRGLGEAGKGRWGDGKDLPEELTTRYVLVWRRFSLLESAPDTAASIIS